MSTVPYAAPPATFVPFDDESMARRVHREGILILGGGRALLMQIAHPLVARGVAEHSNFRADRIDRLLRTLRPMMAMVFGDSEQALAAAERVSRAHDAVRGPGYAAKDPDLLLWVFATLVDTSVLMYRRFVGPLEAPELGAYYEDMRRIAPLLCIDDSTLPGSLDELLEYVRAMSESLFVSAEARDIARALFQSNVLSWPFLASARWLTAGLLPEPLRTQFGLPWSPRRERVLSTLAAISRLVLPRLPGALRAPPWFLMPGK